MKARLLILALTVLVCTSISAQQKGIFRFPDISNESIVFTYESDLWIVDKEGGDARRLSVPAGGEFFAKFSDDGQKIAFSASYDGNVDVYTLPIKGGVPSRLTYHGMPDFVLGWHPNGDQVLFSSSRNSGKQRWSQFFLASTQGGLPKQLPLEHAEFGSFNATGDKIAFIQKSRLFRTWKRYRGGMAADIYTFDLNTGKANQITKSVANEEMPMVSGDKVYYLSDKGPNKRFNLWSCDWEGKSHVQLTNFSDYDVHFPSIGPSEIVFVANGEMQALKLSDNSLRTIPINIIGDFVGQKPRLVTVEKYVQHVGISPSGGRVIVEGRGDIFSLPAKKGIVKNLTQTSGIAERYPNWSPDGKSIGYWSDATGEYQLVVRNLESNKEKVITNFKDGFKYGLFWSPDSKNVAFIDEDMLISIVNVETSKISEVDRAQYKFHGGLEWFRPSWSKDSKWLAYSKTGKDQSAESIYLYNMDESQSHKITAGFYNDHNPMFDPDGKYLYFLSERHFDPVYSNFDNTWVYPNATGINVITLANDTEPPLAFSNDTVAIQKEEDVDLEEDDDKKKKKKKGKKGKKESKDDKDSEEDLITIDLEGMAGRSMELPIPSGNFSTVGAVSGKVIYCSRGVTGDKNAKTKMMMYDLAEKESKMIHADVSHFILSHDGKKALAFSNRKPYVIDIAADQKLEDPIVYSEMKMRLDPRAEWKQIFLDAWRMERDFFYDPEMHGVDWNKVKDTYMPLVDHIASRGDLNFLLGEMIGELNASHTYRGGGDQENAEQVSTGYLGIDWGEKNGTYYIKKIIKGAPWDTETLSPLSTPGLKIKEGDYIFAINGLRLSTLTSPYDALANLADKVVELTYSTYQSIDSAKTVLVKTLSSERRLRNLAWIEKNRSYVDMKSGGKVGYIYVPSTGLDGQKELVRMFYGQHKKEALIIDERFNNGGQIPDRFVELLERKPLAYFHPRNKADWQWPPTAHFGPKVMMINGWSGSGGDAFPYYFKKRELGPLIGTRTWGGLIGISGMPGLIDGGGVTAPTFRMFDMDGNWFPEGHGVEPDIEVPEDPETLAKGIDKQLDKAIEEALRLIESEGYKRPGVPTKEVR